MDNKEYHKQYYQNNKEYFKAYTQDYYAKNKEKYTQKVACPRCGREVHKGNLKRHQKSHLCLTEEEKKERILPKPFIVKFD